MNGLTSDKFPAEDEEVGEDVLAALESLLPPLRDGYQSTSASSFSSSYSEYPPGTETPATSISAQSSPHSSAHEEPKDILRPESPVLDHLSVVNGATTSDNQIRGRWKSCKRHEHECHGCGWYLDKQLLSINYRKLYLLFYIPRALAYTSI